MTEYISKEQQAVSQLMRHIFNENLEVEHLVETAKRKRPDCYIPSKGIVIEVKDIVSAKGKKSSSDAGKTIEAIDYHLQQLSLLGSYDVDLPYLKNWKPKDKIFQALAKKLADHIAAGEQTVDTTITLRIAETVFAKVSRHNSDENAIYVGCTDHFEMVDPEVPEAKSEITKNIQKAAAQIKTFRENENPKAQGWVLLVLKNFRLVGKEHVIEETIKKLGNVDVDQIWSVSSSEGGVIGGDWKRWK